MNAEELRQEADDIKAGKNVLIENVEVSQSTGFSKAKEEENKIEVPVEEPAIEEKEVQDSVIPEEVPDKEPEITATTTSESIVNLEPDIKLSDVAPISLDGIDLELDSTSTETTTDMSTGDINVLPSSDMSAPLETTVTNTSDTVPSFNSWEAPKENIAQESSSFINNEPSFDNKDQFVNPYETSEYETSNGSNNILEYLKSTRKSERKEFVRRNAITTDPKTAAQVVDGIFDNFPYEEAKERTKEYVFNQTAALNITNSQLKDVHEKEPLHSSTREKDEVVFKLNDGGISTDEFPGFKNNFSNQDTESSFVDQQDKIIPFSGNNYEMQQVDTYGNIVNMPNSFGDNDQNLNNDFDNNKPFAA